MCKPLLQQFLLNPCILCLYTFSRMQTTLWEVCIHWDCSDKTNASSSWKLCTYTTERQIAILTTEMFSKRQLQAITSKNLRRTATCLAIDERCFEPTYSPELHVHSRADSLTHCDGEYSYISPSDQNSTGSAHAWHRGALHTLQGFIRTLVQLSVDLNVDKKPKAQRARVNSLRPYRFKPTFHWGNREARRTSFY